MWGCASVTLVSLGNQEKHLPNPQTYSVPFSLSSPRQHGASTGDDPTSQTLEDVHRLKDILSTIQNEETMDVEATVELSGTFLPLRQLYNDQWWFLPASTFADIPFEAHQRTNRSDYLNEAITLYRDLRKLSTPKALHFKAGEKLLQSSITGFNLSGLQQDFDEVM